MAEQGVLLCHDFRADFFQVFGTVVLDQTVQAYGFLTGKHPGKVLGIQFPAGDDTFERIDLDGVLYGLFPGPGIGISGYDRTEGSEGYHAENHYDNNHECRYQSHCQSCLGETYRSDFLVRTVLQNVQAIHFVFICGTFSHKMLNFVRMQRTVGIDYGRARVGVAQSDPLGIFASPLETVPATKIIDYLKNLAERDEIVRFVVGYPLNLDGSHAEAAADVDAFLKKLQKAFPDTPVALEDERFTSVLAHRAMIDGGMKKSDRRDKNQVDKISAAIILQSYLDKKK